LLLILFFSWKYYKKDDYKISILFIVLSGLIFFFFTASDFFLHVWDERYHALVAKNLLKHPFYPTLYDNPILPYDYRSWVGNHIWVHKQPLPLWLMAGSMKIFGISEIALRLPSIIMSTIGIFLTFKIGSYFFNKKIGLFAAFLFSINGLIIELTGGRVATDHIDIVFMFFILLAIFFTTIFIERRNLVYTLLIGLCIGAAVLTKWLPALIVLPIWLLLILNNKSFTIKAIFGHSALLIITIIMVALPWQLYIYKAFPLEAAHEASFNLRHFTEVLDEQTGSVFYFIDRIRINYGELIYLPLVWFLWKIFRNPKNYNQLALFIWFIVPLIFFSLAKTKMQGYILFTAPALFIITAAFFFELPKYRVAHKPKWLFSIVMILFIALPIRYGLERMKPFKNYDRNPKWVLELKKLNESNIQNGILFNYENPIEAMFYTDLVVYSSLPSKDKIVELINQGYQILINDNGNLNDLDRFNNIKIIKLTTATL
tara:strand:+ start:1907 stop:3364 length:1458 start_codon:yes stop_codon:yes gene_type:complete